MTQEISVALIGAGAMGGALLRGWLKNGVIDASRSAVFDPAARDATTRFCSERGLALYDAPTDMKPDAVVIAIKPQMAATALPAYAALARDALVISIMAGQSIASIGENLGGRTRIVRTMPNLPAAVGAGISGLVAGEGVSSEDRALVETLMRAAGEAVWVETEEQIDFVTAISGSGPAYFFLLTEALEEAGAALGLAPDIAARLARAAAVGAGALLENDARSAAALRKAVTSPGGTTEAALKILDGDEHLLRALLKEAAAAAARRARELTD